MGANNQTIDGSNSSFTNVELLLDKKGNEGEDCGEDGNDGVSNMGFINLEFGVLVNMIQK